MSDNNAGNQPRPGGLEALKNHVSQNKVDCLTWLTRVMTLFFTIRYLIPIYGSAQSAYYKVLIASIATSALRLHQRMPPVRLSREYLSSLLLEDSFHYFFYSLIFLYVSPVFILLFPVVLFAVLHAASYSLTLLDTLGRNSWWGARLLISLVEFQQRNILRFAAFTEIIIMPLCIVLVMLGKAGLLTPFTYYYFLTFRYTSRRNPYTRNMFAELRMFAETLKNNQKLPGFIRTLIGHMIVLVSRLAPIQQTAPQQNE